MKDTIDKAIEELEDGLSFAYLWIKKPETDLEFYYWRGKIDGLRQGILALKELKRWHSCT